MNDGVTRKESDKGEKVSDVLFALFQLEKQPLKKFADKNCPDDIPKHKSSIDHRTIKKYNCAMNWAWRLLSVEQHKLLTNPQSSQRDVLTECMNIDTWVIRSVMAIEGRHQFGALQAYWTGFGNRVCKDEVQLQARALKPEWSEDATDTRPTYRQWVKSKIDLAIMRKAAEGEHANKMQGKSLREQQEEKARKRRELIAKRTGALPSSALLVAQASAPAAPATAPEEENEGEMAEDEEEQYNEDEDEDGNNDDNNDDASE